MYVCICRAVRESRIRAVIESGARTVDEVEGACGAGGDCGSCREEIAGLIDAHRLVRGNGCTNAARDMHASHAA